MTGLLSDQFFISENIDLLNSAVPNDQIAYILTTLDFYMAADYGDVKLPRINFYSDIRFQFAWGSYADGEITGATFTIDDVGFMLPSTRVNKHLIWLREIWTKIKFGDDLANHNHYLQMGLIPYSVGRGISLGAAYNTVGFLGFTPTYSIEQYAPAVLFNIGISKNSNSIAYIAVIEGEQDSINTILAPIRTMEIGGCAQRGVGANSFIATLENITKFENSKGHWITVEPYLIYFSAPDKNLEFISDVDSNLATAGVCVEADYKKINWGFECGKNFGAVTIKAIDRNQTVFGKLPNGYIVLEEYTKVFDQDAKTPGAQRALATDANAFYVDEASPQNSSENGKQIGPDLYNAYDRFRPAQNVNLTGYYFIADVEYDCIPNKLKGAIGVAYFSGSDRKNVDVNEMEADQCMNQEFSGFVPLQSIYSGKRIRHFVMLNQGVPRYTIATPQTNFNPLNSSSQLSIDTLNATTNLVFVGTRVAFSPERYKKNKVLVAPNIIAYWAADTSYVSDEELPENSPFNKQLDNYLGTELNLEFSFNFSENLQFVGYAGMLIPGTYYKQIAGTIVRKYNLPIGADIAWISNLAISYAF